MSFRFQINVEGSGQECPLHTGCGACFGLFHLGASGVHFGQEILRHVLDGAWNLDGLGQYVAGFVDSVEFGVGKTKTIQDDGILLIILSLKQ